MKLVQRNIKRITLIRVTKSFLHFMLNQLSIEPQGSEKHGIYNEEMVGRTEREMIVKIPKEERTVVELPFSQEVNGKKLGVNSLYYTKDGRPWYPIMGEFHFSRWTADQWEKSLRKMKAGGIEIVASYVFWIHHEEKEGEWDFTGNRCLHDFLGLCAKTGLKVWLRIGPWAHGECRNGGFPDWLMEKPFPLRENNPEYLLYVRKFFEKIYEQSGEYLWKFGGPIIGIQIENEYGHCGGLTGQAGMEHMKTLKELARNIGFDVPFYTATAWGGACVPAGEMLPVYGGYTDAPWERHTHELDPSPNFLFTSQRDDSQVGSDLANGSKEETDLIDVSAYPFSTAELGGGLEVTGHRRTVPFPLDVFALVLCKLGSGANLLGYYMYHGGTNPDGKYSTLQETGSTGAPNELPVKSYDFFAPIRETGMIGESYGKLKMLHLFLQEWGELLAPTWEYIPPESASDPSDLETLRFSVRHNYDKNCGFIFFNNHLRKRQLTPHIPVHFSVQTVGRTFEIPPFALQTDDMKIIPYNLPLNGAVLVSTNAQPLTRIGNRYFFYTDEEPYYQIEGEAPDIITLTAQEAEQVYRFDDRLYLSSGSLTQWDDGIWLETQTCQNQVICYCETGAPKKIIKNVEPDSHTVQIVSEEPMPEAAQYELELAYSFSDHTEDVLLGLDFLGDRIEVYQNGHLEYDWFTSGTPFQVSLKRIGYPNRLTVKVFPSEKGRYFDLPVAEGCQLEKADAISVYRILVE